MFALSFVHFAKPQSQSTRQLEAISNNTSPPIAADMSEVKPPPQMKTNRKPKWVLDHEAKAKALKSEVKAEDKKVHDATDMFRRSKDWKTIHVSENLKEGKRKEKTFRVIKEEGTKSKRRRDSSEEEEEDADAPARKTYVRPRLYEINY